VACRFTVDVVQFANLEPIERDLLFKVRYCQGFSEKRSDYVMRTPEDEQCENFERFLGMRFPSVSLAYAHWPNKSPEPTPTAVTIRAVGFTKCTIARKARLAPAAVVAHL
jgi:hypothetical protein